MHRLTAEHVLHADLAHLPGEPAARLQQLEDCRQRAHRDAALAALSHYAPTRGPRRRGDRDDHFVRLGVVEDAGQVRFGVAPHAYSVDAQPALVGVVVEEAHGREPELAIAHDLAHHHAAALACAGDDHRALTLAATPKGCERAALVDAARDRPHGYQEDE